MRAHSSGNSQRPCSKVSRAANIVRGIANYDGFYGTKRLFIMRIGTISSKTREHISIFVIASKSSTGEVGRYLTRSYLNQLAIGQRWIDKKSQQRNESRKR